MTKKELVAAVAGKSGLTARQSASALEAFIEIVGASLVSGDPVRVSGFGVFKTKERVSKEGMDFSSGKRIVLNPTLRVVFEPAKALKDRVQEGE